MRSSYRSMVILTGAGISAESGIRTFRDANGLWEDHRIEDVATPEAWWRDPALVLRFYNARRQQLRSPGIQPNAAHRALAALENTWSGELLLVTQNVDDLHERAGSRNLIHMHGELLKRRCTRCDTVDTIEGDMLLTDACMHCGSIGALRPDIVWFGEMPYDMDRIADALSSCDLFVAIGTSGHVYPAAGFVQLAQRAGAHTVEINLEPSLVNNRFGEHRLGPATETVPAFVQWITESA